MKPVIQCAINFSEGRNSKIVKSIVDAAQSVPEAVVADYSADADHNRMVLTILGGPKPIQNAVLAAARTAVELIDLASHKGGHPRIGAVDVVPLVPVQGITMQECVATALNLAQNVAETLSLPVYLYENAALSNKHKQLPNLRRGGFERLMAEGLTGDMAPDLGPHRVHPTAGAVVIGARGPLVAYNVNLDSADYHAAHEIAKEIRSGRAGIEGVRTIAVSLASQKKVQVSMNIISPETAPVPQVYNVVKTEAAKRGIGGAESEVIGLVSERFLCGATAKDINAPGLKETQILEYWLRTAFR
ncbi:MAG: glutamate formimidoyltransferase [Armatimonadota bacterium]